MNLHIELDSSHPAYEWLEAQADKIGAKGHFGTHLDCYTSVPTASEYNLSAYVLDCTNAMPSAEEVVLLPSLKNQAIILYTGNMYRNDYGSKAYFNVDTTLSEEVLSCLLDRHPAFILIDSYGIGKHGIDHISKDKHCESVGCYVIENIRVTPKNANLIQKVRITFNPNYPSTGKSCKVTY